MAKDEKKDARTIRPFADFIREQNKGRTHDELSTALNDLVSAVHAHGKEGSLTFTIKVKPLKDNIEILSVTDEIKVKAPASKRPASVFFADDDGNLTRDDPKQMKFRGMEVVDGEPDAAKRAAGDTE